MKKLLLSILFLFTVGCSNANKQAFFALGQSRHVKCYSGDIVIYDGWSSGKIENESHSDGYYFQDKKTEKLIETNAMCVIS